MRDWFRLLRPKQWSKNLLVLAALLFTRSYTDPHLVGLTVLAFAAMCLLSSAVYAANDLADVERDRRHPVKRNRPIASGRLSRSAATLAVALCAALAVALALPLGNGALAVLGAYVLLQVLYNGFLKSQPVADVFTIASGFVLRAVLGAAAIGVRVSPWLLFCTGMLALLLGFAKRRHEFLVQGEERGRSRESLDHYTRESLDALVLVSAAGAAMSYGIYAIDSPTAAGHPALIVTPLFVLYGICRYVFLTFRQGDVGEPETLLFSDPHLLASILLFTLAAVVAMSGAPMPFVEPAVPVP